MCGRSLPVSFVYGMTAFWVEVLSRGRIKHYYKMHHYNGVQSSSSWRELHAQASAGLQASSVALSWGQTNSRANVSVNGCLCLLLFRGPHLMPHLVPRSVRRDGFSEHVHLAGEGTAAQGGWMPHARSGFRNGQLCSSAWKRRLGVLQSSCRLCNGKYELGVS